MKNCNIKENDLLAYCYSELDSEATMRIKKHLTTCKYCLSKVDKFEKTLTLAKKQKLKEVPDDILNNYTQEVFSKLGKSKESKVSYARLLQDKISDFADNLGSVFSPKLIPVVVGVSILIFSFIFFQQSKIDSVEFIGKEVALLEQLDEYTEDIFLAQNGESLTESLVIVDEIVLAQLEEEIDLEDIFYDLQFLQELDEEVIDEDDIVDDFNILDELELESATS